MTEDVGAMLQKGLTDWWNEETEYVFQRIERWAAYARGYNRLRSQRLSRGRMTMQGGQEPRWSISSNKLIIDDSSWSPRFHTLKRSRRKSRSEETKINCCGTFNYQSNSNLDSNCLEAYRYDHSIYFKTIGDIRNSKKDQTDTKNEHDDRISVGSEELVEWDVSSVSDFIANQLLEDGLTSENIKTIFTTGSVQNVDAVDSVTWSNVDLTKLCLNEEDLPVVDEENNEDHSTMVKIEGERNNNCIEDKMFVVDANLKNQQMFLSRVKTDGNDIEDSQSDEEASRNVQQSTIVIDNDAIWPSVLLSYTNGIDNIGSSYHYRDTRNYVDY
ncbi:PREDICTED: uncharacterized protein LOC107186403 [Dufourea novaeangliae]|uniref:Uncharacterized protein n=1 Tax=Dufourea novaeangliae TaxID=178035 RepID=A0A154P8D6_DUFNO|nr:PREDICTED: uncharacterized protein LOC107186403 [Dufourea novaeangliae]KZC08196.1 hypothetical protein WN55_10067 [Dufourea novaeangliae]